MKSKALTLNKETLRTMRLRTGLKAGPIVQGSDSDPGPNPAPSSIVIQECALPMPQGIIPLVGMPGQ